MLQELLSFKESIDRSKALILAYNKRNNKIPIDYAVDYDKKLIVNYLYGDGILEEFIHEAYRHDDSELCLKASMIAAESPFIETRNIGTQFIKKTICEKKLQVKDKTKLIQFMKAILKKEPLYPKFDNQDDFVFRLSREDIIKNIEETMQKLSP